MRDHLRAGKRFADLILYFFGNLVRILPAECEAVVDPASWELPPLFAALQRAGQISTEEMRDVFNLGVGLIAVLPPAAVEA